MYKWKSEIWEDKQLFQDIEPVVNPSVNQLKVHNHAPQYSEIILDCCDDSEKTFEIKSIDVSTAHHFGSESLCIYLLCIDFPTNYLQ